MLVGVDAAMVLLQPQQLLQMVATGCIVGVNDIGYKCIVLVVYC